MLKKILNKFIYFSLILIFPINTLVSCSSNRIVAKKYLPWGDKLFNRKYETISYSNAIKEAKLINEIDYTKKSSNAIYQMLVYSFADRNNDGIGDFIGAKKKLPYIKELGFDQIWLSPIHPASSYHGYDVIDYTKVAPELGGMKAFDEFLKEAHNMNIKVYLDMVFNHTSYEHPWFQKALKDETFYKSFYEFNSLNKTYGDTNKLPLSEIEKFNNIKEYIESDKDYVSKFWAGMPDLNLSNSYLFDQLKLIHEFWVKKGIDGFRYDAFMEYYSSHNENSHNYPINKMFALFRKHIENASLKYRNKNFEPFMLGEWWDTNDKILPYLNWIDSNGNINKALTSGYDAMHFKNKLVPFMSYSDMKKIVSQFNKKAPHFQWTPFLDNHDEVRWMAKYLKFIHPSIQDFSKYKFSSVDQKVSNISLFSLLVRPGNPIIFQGDELGYIGTKKYGDAGLREPIKWDDSKYICSFYDKRTGESSDFIKINESRLRPNSKTQISNSKYGAWLIKKLNKWRSNNPALGKTDPSTLDDLNKYANDKNINVGESFIRIANNKKFLIAFTMNGKKTIFLKNKYKKIVIKSSEINLNDRKLDMPSYSYIILEI